tara:strand:+ start:189 stop:683 length:495 start_codon:yes stop_codon:yes gene_type:complete
MESKNMIDISEYEGLYKFDLDLNQVYSYYTDRYITNCLNHKNYYFVRLSKNNIRTKFYLHRLVYMCNNPTEDISLFEVDHIDNNPQNNNIENLRVATRSDNQSNKKVHKNKLGIKYICKAQNGYRFQLIKNGIKYNKRFKNLQDAIDYRDIKVKEICGEYANLG